MKIWTHDTPISCVHSYLIKLCLDKMPFLFLVGNNQMLDYITANNVINLELCCSEAGDFIFLAHTHKIFKRVCLYVSLLNVTSQNDFGVLPYARREALQLIVGKLLGFINQDD